MIEIYKKIDFYLQNMENNDILCIVLIFES